jgi:hypothetical protein
MGKFAKVRDITLQFDEDVISYSHEITNRRRTLVKDNEN